jgi:hypothetical protein
LFLELIALSSLRDGTALPPYGFRSRLKRKKMADRYKAISGSISGHCCFDATVVDTNKPVRDVTGKALDGQFQQVCECYDLSNAEHIAAALSLLPIAALEITDGMATD